MLGRKGQISWLWAIMVTGLALGLLAAYYVITDQVQSKLLPQALLNGADENEVTQLKALFDLGIAAALFGWGIFVIIISSQKGGLI